MVRRTLLPFELPDSLSAAEPPERRGLARDGVRLLAADRSGGALRHGRFRDLPGFLRSGDLLVLNASRTLPAALDARLRRPGAPTRFPVEVRLARRLDDRSFAVLLLDAFENPLTGADEGRLDFGAGLQADLLGPEPGQARLRRLRFSAGGAELMGRLSRLGKPVRYWYADRPWGLDWYQTVFAREPGSMEMPSAGRAFTWELLGRLRSRGVGTAFLVLHAGLSSYMDAAFDATHPVSTEPYRVPPATAAAVNAARAAGGRVVAVGTTVVRALESAVNGDGRLVPGEGRTALRITAAHALKTVDGLITGFHEPEASHLDLLSAFLSEARLREIYAAALEERYLWHEFGDINLIL